jgi:hypothetical protein
MLQLTEDQQTAFKQVKTFFKNPEEPALLIYGSAGTGKCCGSDTPIIMSNGEVKMVQDIQQGDLLMGDDSTPREVLSTTQGIGQLYQVSTGNDHYIVNDAHILTLRWNAAIIQKNNLYSVEWLDTNTQWQTSTFDDIHRARAFAQGVFHLVDIPIKEFLELPTDIRVRYSTVYARIEFQPNSDLDELETALAWGKQDIYQATTIPNHFKLGSIWTRASLITGIQQSGWTLENAKSDTLIQDIEWVVNSMGLKINWEQGGRLIPYKRLETPTIKALGPGQYFGFMLNGNGRFVLGNFIVTHNTELTRYIVDYIHDQKITNIGAIAPTHKARRVLERILQRDRLFRIPSFTVASALGKMREHSYIGTHKYRRGSTQKMDSFGCFILDEVSMLDENDLNEILDYCCLHDKKIILIGDACQITSPSQDIECDGDICYKSTNSAFTIANRVKLSEIVRQVKDSDIILLSSTLRDRLEQDLSIPDLLEITKLETNTIVCSYQEAYADFHKEWKEQRSVRMIAYTNAAVRAHNLRIRDDLGYPTTTMQPYELLTGYNNVGWPVPLIENGSDYTITAITQTTSYCIERYPGLVGHLVDLEDTTDNQRISRGLFFIDVTHSKNLRFMEQLVARAELVNQRFSTKESYRHYCKLKNKAVFLENIYKWNNRIWTESELRQLQPLLFTKVNEVIDIARKTIAISELSQKLSEQYGDIIEGRLHDNKAFGDGELFADQFMVVEKDIDYGYSITAHKAQASTYDSVYVDEIDFNKIKDKWNYKLGRLEHRTREKNQLRYVAYTRASSKLRIIQENT